MRCIIIPVFLEHTNIPSGGVNEMENNRRDFENVFQQYKSDSLEQAKEEAAEDLNGSKEEMLLFVKMMTVT